jgi:predicted phage tail protein
LLLVSPAAAGVSAGALAAVVSAAAGVSAGAGVASTGVSVVVDSVASVLSPEPEQATKPNIATIARALIMFFIDNEFLKN